MDLDIFDTFETAAASAPKENNLNLPSSLTSLEQSRKRLIENENIHVKDEQDHDDDDDDDDDQPALKARKEATLAAAEAEAEAASTPKGPARIYKFKLDTFQQQAVDYIEAGESVLVAAHTSAGKTAVAEYAIAKSLRDRQRVIYTSPIKALSNQKFRDLQEEFGDVGLMTGDMTINPNAACLIMTTEILRSMLYRGSEVVREVAWVIYDEVHYMRDKDRGVVWEESIILLPHKVRFVFLSATIPNAPSFVSWVSKIHHQPCHVVYTDYRPVPLQHYLFPAAAEGLYLVVDEKSRFREDNFQRAMSSLNPLQVDGAGDSNPEKKSKKNVVATQAADLLKIVRLIMERALDPCIVFSFSKKDCEAYALQMARLDFNNAEERKLVETVYANAMESLSADDQTLPQIQTMLPLLRRGIGIHHGGLLPILKEVIEILFQEGLIKLLFATETFSIGINMPAKTVVFTATRKFDGKDFRWVTAGEYIQMSGRAGRRGKDDKGIVIQMVDEKMEPDVAKNMIYGASDPLYSSYRVGFNMVLNMLRVEGADPQNLIRASFHQFTQEEAAPGLLKRADELEKEVNAITVENEALLSEYVDLRRLAKDISRELCSIVMRPVYCLPFLQPGRLVRVVFGDVDFGWGVVVAGRKMESKNLRGKNAISLSRWLGKTSKLNSKNPNPDGEFCVDVMLEVRRLHTGVPTSVDPSNTSPLAHLEFMSALLPTESPEQAAIAPEMMQVPIGLDAIAALTVVRVNLPRELNKDQSKAALKKMTLEVARRFGEKPPVLTAVYDNVPVLDPVKDMGITASEVESLVERQSEMVKRLSSPRYKAVSADTVALEAYNAKVTLASEAVALRKQATELRSVTMKDELKKMRAVLRDLDYVTAEGVLTMKGRFACEVSAANELVLTNMVFNGAFTDLSVDQTVALLSCFVHTEGGADIDHEKLKCRTDMHKAYRAMIAIAKEVAESSVKNRLIPEEDELLKTINPVLIDLAYAWSTGAKFVEICQMADVFEGSIIRSLRRLEELLRQLAAASVAIGNQELVQLFTDGSAKIRRGVVFAASLYL